MKKVLGIDYGKKRIGVALSDEERKYAFPFKTIENYGDQEVLKVVDDIIQKEKVGRIVIGLPVNLKGEEKEQVKVVQKFADNLKKGLELPVDFEDERLTTKLAERLLRDNPQKKAKQKAALDQQSAVLILQGYLDRNRKRAGVTPAQVK